MLTHRSPALTAIYNEIKNSDRNRILDLGPMNKGCFDLFSRLSCKVQVEDMRAFLVEHLAQGNAPSTFDVRACLNEYQESEKFDVVLAWDLFNYLEIDQVRHLFELLRPFCKANTLLYMLRYVENNIPALPRQFTVKDQYLLTCAQEENKPRVCAKHSTLQLLTVMPMCFVQDTAVGQEGMLRGVTEHVLRFEASDEFKHRQSKSEGSRKKYGRDDAEKTIMKSHFSPSIAEVMSLMNCTDDIVVLDLAAPQNRTEDIIVQRSGSYFRVDLFSLIQRSRDTGSDALNLSILQNGLPRKFDVILAWDLLNFCSPSQIAQLDTALSSLSHHETFLLSLMYTAKSRPQLPSKFEIGENNRLDIGVKNASAASDSPITGAALLRLLSAFNMDQTFAYRSGMDREIIEYIFVHNSLAHQTQTAERAV